MITSSLISLKVIDNVNMRDFVNTAIGVRRVLSFKDTQIAYKDVTEYLSNSTPTPEPPDEDDILYFFDDIYLCKLYDKLSNFSTDFVYFTDIYKNYKRTLNQEHNVSEFDYTEVIRYNFY